MGNVDSLITNIQMIHYNKKNKGKLPNFINISNDNDAPPNSLIDSTARLNVKTSKRQGVGARCLARSTLGVEGRAGVLGWGLGRATSNSITHMDLHKPNNKLVSA